MPLGNQYRPIHDGTPLIVPVPPSALTPAAPSLVERQAGLEIWDHKTADVTASLWPSGVFSADYQSPVTRVSIYSTEPLYIGLDRAASIQPGGYELYHPGNGFLESAIPATKRVTIATTTGLAPGSRIELWAYAGSYALGS